MPRMMRPYYETRPQRAPTTRLSDRADNPNLEYAKRLRKLESPARFAEAGWFYHVEIQLAWKQAAHG